MLQMPRNPESQKIRKQARGWKQTKNKQPIPLQAKLRLMLNETKQISLSVLDDTGCFRTKHGSESKCSCSFQMVQTEKLLWVGKHLKTIREVSKLQEYTLILPPLDMNWDESAFDIIKLL